MTKSKSKAQKEQRLQKRSYNELMYSAERNDELREECKRLGLVREEPVNVFDAWLYFATNHDVSWSEPLGFAPAQP